MTDKSEPPPFLAKTYDIVDDPANSHVVGWSPDGRSFVVWDKLEFERDILPRNFKHNNFSSFIRQLNTYGFRKVDSTRLEWANEYFRQGHRELLRDIQRQGSDRTTKKKDTTKERLTADRAALALESRSALVEVGGGAGPLGGAGGPIGQDQYLATVRDKEILKEEVKRLRMQQEALVRQMQEMGNRQLHTEQTLQKVLQLLQSVTGGQGLGAQLASALQPRLMLTSGRDADEESSEGGYANGSAAAVAAGRKRARRGQAYGGGRGAEVPASAPAGAAPPRSTAMEIVELEEEEELLMNAGPSGGTVLPPPMVVNPLAPPPPLPFNPGPSSSFMPVTNGAPNWTNNQPYVPKGPAPNARPAPVVAPYSVESPSTSGHSNLMPHDLNFGLLSVGGASGSSGQGPTVSFPTDMDDWLLKSLATNDLPTEPLDTIDDPLILQALQQS